MKFKGHLFILHIFAVHVKHMVKHIDYNKESWGARWRSGRASDSESRGPGFDPHRRNSVVSLSKTL